MSTENDEHGRDELLAMFQDITHLEDIDECLQLLRVANWNLDEAIQLHFANQYNSIPSVTTATTGTSFTNTEPEPIILPEDEDEALFRAQFVTFRLLSRCK